ncbi:hypothetical protein [Microbacterium sp. SSM24]|uniref:hypothetical protein n=1 Tax=Microbacterium sp. SSM24 TaxID=2991714 RepID=UPI0029D41724|nr:hypothetical protein [Microbacterium sp. SSM24]
MEPIFTFLGQYWWLIFPLLGVMGAAGRAWEQGARRRHKRRLEVLHAKAELKAAARGTAPVPIAGSATGQQPAVAPKTAPVPTGTQLERLFAAHDAVTARWLDYELDVAKIIAFPAMSDGRQPLTAAFLRAKRIADGLRPASAKARLSKDQLAEYRNAVADYEVAFDVAERDARRIKDSSFSEIERKRLDTAKQLLSVAIDQAATPAERQLAYRRVRQELDGLISLSDEAIEVLETKVALELPSSAPAPAPAVKTPDAAPPRISTTPPAAPAASGADPAHPAPAPWPIPARPQADPAPGRVIRPKSHP